MRVLITGGTGRVGRPITEKFVSNGWDVRVIGAEPEFDVDGITYTHMDIRDFDAMLEQLDGVDAVVHLAAYPSTLSGRADDVFKLNVAGTHTVFEAASKVGIKRIAQASSINALGSYWGYDDRKFDYFPLDENHNLYTTDTYSFSKQMVEEIADYFWRRDGISSASFRLPAVWSPQAIEDGNLSQRMNDKREKLAEFATLPQEEQQKQIAEVRKSVLDYRARRLFDWDARQAGLHEGEGDFEDWLWSSYFVDRYNYWTFIHTDDSTQAFEKAITADYEGAHPLFANSDRNYLNVDSEMLLEMFFPHVDARSKPIHGADTLVSYDRARDVIGFEPTVHTV